MGSGSEKPIAHAQVGVPCFVTVSFRFSVSCFTTTPPWFLHRQYAHVISV